jgi:hypothetical protein
MIKEQEFRQIGQFYKLYSCKDKYCSKNQCSYNSSEEYFMLELLWDFEKAKDHNEYKQIIYR